MSLPSGRTHLHLLARRDPVALRTMRLQREGGIEVRCVLLHDAVIGGTEGLPCDSLALRAEDVRRRGLPLGAVEVIEDGDLVDLITGSGAVTSWP